MKQAFAAAADSLEKYFSASNTDLAHHQPERSLVRQLAFRVCVRARDQLIPAASFRPQYQQSDSGSANPRTLALQAGGKPHELKLSAEVCGQAFAPQIAGGQPAQLVVHTHHQFFAREPSAVAGEFDHFDDRRFRGHVTTDLSLFSRRNAGWRHTPV